MPRLRPIAEAYARLDEDLDRIDHRCSSTFELEGCGAEVLTRTRMACSAPAKAPVIDWSELEGPATVQSRRVRHPSQPDSAGPCGHSFVGASTVDSPAFSAGPAPPRTVHQPRPARQLVSPSLLVPQGTSAGLARSHLCCAARRPAAHRPADGQSNLTRTRA
jgi:hypothetical protein